MRRRKSGEIMFLEFFLVRQPPLHFVQRNETPIIEPARVLENWEPR